MNNKLKLLLSVYEDSCLSFRYMINEINIKIIFFGLIPTVPLIIAVKLINSIYIAILLFIPVAIHFVVYFFTTKNKLSVFDHKHKENISIIEFYLIENTKYWTKYRFQKFMFDFEAKCELNEFNKYLVLQETKHIIKNRVDLTDKKEKIISGPRRGLLLWLLAPVIGIFTVIFQELERSAIKQNVHIIVVLVLAYILCTIIFIAFEMLNKEYNSEYKKIELLNFVECAELIFNSNGHNSKGI